MKITQIDLFQVTYRLLDRRYAWSGGKSVSAFLSSIIRISIDAGISGYGEVCPLGSAYIESFAGGVPAGVKELEGGADVQKYRSEMYRRFQLNVGGDPDEDIRRIENVLGVLSPGDVLVADANFLRAHGGGGYGCRQYQDLAPGGTHESGAAQGPVLVHRDCHDA